MDLFRLTLSRLKSHHLFSVFLNHSRTHRVNDIIQLLTKKNWIFFLHKLKIWFLGNRWAICAKLYLALSLLLLPLNQKVELKISFLWSSTKLDDRQLSFADTARSMQNDNFFWRIACVGLGRRVYSRLLISWSRGTKRGYSTRVRPFWLNGTSYWPRVYSEVQ